MCGPSLTPGNHYFQTQSATADIMNLISEETLRYYTQNNNCTFSLSGMLLEVFLGIILFREYHSLLQEDLYWSNSEDCNPYRMPRQFGRFSESLSIDEEMIPYTGRHSEKMYMRGKPIKFGYKYCILASSHGYPFNLQVYEGKEEASEDKTPLGTELSWI
ncbi:hypothetical protein AVEN_55872-1 [Araneus ventricosus]|uniref:PiggyBac transposable element-derived protein domain-containing protein n=1 Tax=Araneus ventricosus TaxID=182803 RepID=A0A4Y2GTW6_ARAVE|nr:hypothetical protein AVEN_55872-1 [Araneus ventricosus]